MTAPAKREGWSLYREPSYVLLMLGIFLTALGSSWLMNGRHLIVASVVTAVGLTLLIGMRVLRSRSRHRS